MARRTTQSKKYGGKISKTYIAEAYFSKNPDISNEEIAKIISDDISSTSINQVAMMRSRFKNKMAELIANHPIISSSVKKIINSEDLKHSTIGALHSINNQVILREEFKQLKQVEAVKLIEIHQCI